MFKISPLGSVMKFKHLEIVKVQLVCKKKINKNKTTTEMKII